MCEFEGNQIQSIVEDMLVCDKILEVIRDPVRMKMRLRKRIMRMKMRSNCMIE